MKLIIVIWDMLTKLTRSDNNYYYLIAPSRALGTDTRDHDHVETVYHCQ